MQSRGDALIKAGNEGWQVYLNLQNTAASYSAILTNCASA